MLALRLQGSRSIRAKHSNSPCLAAVARAGVAGRGSPGTLVRSYKTDSKKPDDEVVAERSENLVSLATKSFMQQNPGPFMLSTSNKKTSRPKPEDDGDDTLEQNAVDTLKIIKDSMEFLKEFQANPQKYAAKHEAGANATRSLKTQFDPIKGKPKYDLQQNKILIDTMNILKDALQVHVQTTALKNRSKRVNEDMVVTRAAEAFIADTQSTIDQSQAKPAGKPETKTASPKKPSKMKKEPEVKEAAPETRPKKSEATPRKKESGKSSERDTQLHAQLSQALKKQPQKGDAKSKGKTTPKVSDAVEASLASVIATTKARKRKEDSAKLRAQAETALAEGPPADDVSATGNIDTVSASLASVSRSSARKEKPRLNKHKTLGNTMTKETPAESTLDQGSHASEDFFKKVHDGAHAATVTGKKHDLDINVFRAEPVSALVPIDAGPISVPLIQYGLDRVLFKEGVYPLQDARTRVWNFDPYLSSIMPVSDFDFEALKEYITSSKDTKLINITKDEKKKYTGSTSSMTSTLAHFHFLLSQWRPLSHARLSKQYDTGNERPSSILKAPSATFMTYKDGVYAIDADKEWDDETILSMLGKSMEKLLTVPKDEFVRYHRDRSHELTDEEKGQDEAYHYTTYGDFMMRSQLDAYDPRLPGTGIYDLKTRAVVSIRMDATHHENGLGYEIRQRDGNWESFEREYHDLIKSAFLKYSLQVRMGRMDGIFVAFHNVERIFGFQYIPLEEMDQSIHGTMDKTLGDMEFTASLKLYNDLLNQATARFPKQSLRIHVEAKTSDAAVPFLYFFAEPVTEEEIKEVQESKKGQVEKFKQRLGIIKSDKADAEVEPTVEEPEPVEEVVAIEQTQDSVPEEVEIEAQAEDSEEMWEDMMNVVEDTMNKDAEGITAIRDAIEEALEQSGLLQAKSSEEAERYVEALLRSIVDPDVELAKVKGVSSLETEVSEESERAQHSREIESAQPGVIAPKKSTLGSLFSWFSFSPKEVEATTQDAIKEATPEAKQEAARKEDSPVHDTESKDTKEADSGTSPELVELLVKLTSRVGTTTNIRKKQAEKAEQQELSDDDAKIQAFERILAEMMPKVVESTQAEIEAEGEVEVEDEDSPAATPSKPAAGKRSSGPKEVFGMVVSVRNKVNLKDVERPENLKSVDLWDIEYAMQEIHAHQVSKLYQACKSRRKAALYHDPDRYVGTFATKAKDQLVQYTNAGRVFRRKEDEIIKNRPVWIVGQHEPLPAKEVFTGAGAKLDHVLPSLEHPRPNPDEFPGVLDYMRAGEAPVTQKKSDQKPEKVSSVSHRKGSPKSKAGTTKSGQKEKELSKMVEHKQDSSVSDAEVKRLNGWMAQQGQLLAAEAKQDGKVAETEDGDKKEDSIAKSVASLKQSEEAKASSFKEWREKSKQK